MTDDLAMTDLLHAVRRHADAHADADGLVVTNVPGLRMMRVRAPSGPMRSVYRPLVCLVLQGAKRMTIGRDTRLARAGQAVIVGIDLPVVGHIVEASIEAPYLAVAIELDFAVLHAIDARLADVPEAAPVSVFDAPLDDDILGCASRLVRLLDAPEAEPFVRPGVLHELHYWLLRSAHGPALRALATPHGHTRRIAASIDLIRTGFRETLPAERLAAAAQMSPSAFRRHFKATTSLSPLQFQKQLRLVEARRLMLGSGLAASQAAMRVGYASVSQFTREYGRFFGQPPRQDAKRDRAQRA